MTSEEKAFFEGFYGDDFRKFKRLGVETVRSLYEADRFPSELQHNAAGEWLGREARRAAMLKTVKIAVAILGLCVAVYVALK